jgi:hypothetical protein
MKYDTTPLSIDTAGVDLTQPEPEMRFVPDEERAFETGEISHPTIAKCIGFDTFIEPPPSANKLEKIKDELNAPKYRTWALTALLASVSAFAGGIAVYWVSADPPITVAQPRPVTVAPQTEIKTSDTFVSKPAADSAAAEPLVPHTPETPVAKSPSIQVPTATEIATETVEGAEPVASEPISPPPANVAPVITLPEPQREAKVGAYVVEKPAGRKPLARCADGTYSFSASKSAACSGRGGVGEWMGEGKPTSATPARQAAYVLGPRGGCYYLDSSSKKIYVEKKYCEQ